MKSEKTKSLKEQFRDKSLTKQQRQELMQEIVRESYKNDKRKAISLHDQRFLQFMGFSMFLIEKLFDMITTAVGLEENFIVSTINVLLCIPALIFMILWLVKTTTCKIELEDEMARENMNKARQGISVIVMILLLAVMAVVLILDSFMGINISFTINAKNIGDIAMLILWGYFALESGLFLIHEGKTTSDDENEEN